MRYYLDHRQVRALAPLLRRAAQHIYPHHANRLRAAADRCATQWDVLDAATRALTIESSYAMAQEYYRNGSMTVAQLQTFADATQAVCDVLGIWAWHRGLQGVLRVPAGYPLNGLACG